MLDNNIIAEIGKVYDRALVPVGSQRHQDGVTYTFCSIASGTFIKKYNMVYINANGAAVKSSADVNLVWNGISPVSINALTAAKYAFIATDSQGAGIGIDVAISATASGDTAKDFSGQRLVGQGTAAATNDNLQGVAIGTAIAGTGTASAGYNTDLATLQTMQKSNLVGMSTAATLQSSTASAGGALPYTFSATAASATGFSADNTAVDVRLYINKGDVLIGNGVARVVNGVSASAFTINASGIHTATAASTGNQYYYGSITVKSIFK